MNKLNTAIKKHDYFDIFIFTEIMLVLLACLTQSFADIFTSFLHAAMYLILLVYFLFRMYRMILTKQKLDIEFYALVAFGVIALVALIISNYSVNGSIIPSFHFLRSFIFNISVLMLMYIASNSKVSLKIIKYIVFAVGIVTLIYCLMYILMHDKAFYFNGFVSKYLTLGLVNPNKTSIMLCLFLLTMVHGIFITHNRIFKIIYAVITAILLFLIYKTYSRNIYIAVCFFTCAMLWLMFKRKPKVSNVIWVIVCFIPILFSIFYLIIVDNEIFNKIFSFLVSEGKGLQSREAVWRDAIEWIKSGPLFGWYSETTADYISPAPHNVHLYVMCAYGIPAYIPFIFMHIFTFIKVNKNKFNRMKSCSMFAVACVVVIGIAESTIFSSLTGLFMFIGLFIAMIPTMGELPEWNEYEERRLKKHKS